MYRITCQLCSNINIGESSRTIHDRLNEHLFANTPIAPSYNEEAMAQHYRQKHLEKTARLKSEIIKTEINEAIYICKEKPIIN